jgi:hypothetical protein
MRSVLMAVALGGLVSAASAEEAARPDFAGRWRFNAERSDDMRAAIEAAAGPGQMKGDNKFRIIPRGGGAGEVERIELRSWMFELAARPEHELLEIEQSAAEFKTGFGDDVRIYYFGRESTRQDEMGVKHTASVRWNGEQLVVEERGEGSRMTEIYTLLPGGAHLVVALRWEHKRLQAPLEVGMILDRVEERE